MKKITLVLLLLFTVSINAQLPAFNLEITKTDETCLGNGTLTFSVSDITPGASMLYKVYLLPDTTTAIAITEQNYLGSLNSGTYKVIAMQSLGDDIQTQEQTVTINSNIAPFSFTVSSENQNCSQGGSIIVNTVLGTATAFEIISGPVTRPLQSSNVFEGLSSGTYNVRAFNECGVGKVKTYTLYTLNTTLSISDPVYPDAVNALCDSITVNNVITASSGFIGYPVTVKHIISSLDITGDPIIINEVYETGNFAALTVSVTMPRYLNQAYTYDISVTDNCNTVFEKNEILVDPNISLALSTGEAPCAEKFLKLSASKYTDSYTVAFLDAPTGFNPADFNNTPDGPFTESSVSYGDEDNPVPFGDYVVEITDVCGRVAVETITVQFVKPSPVANGFNNGCFSEFGKIIVGVPQQSLLTAKIVDAPDTYTAGLPEDVTSFITGNPAQLVLPDMPLGVYTIQFTDDCGFDYEVQVEVPPFVEQDFGLAMLPSCGPDYGTIRFRSGNGPLVEARITAAPASFGQSLPYDVTEYLNGNWQLFLADLPEGTYTFKGTDFCGIVNEKTVEVEGYNAPQNAFEFIPKCGSFSVKVTDSSNGLQGAQFWLQKYFPATDSWGHPTTGELYTEGAVPDNTNGIALNNNATKDNLNYSGKFRVVKKFETFSTGTDEMTKCVSVLGVFNFSDVLNINTAYTLACIGSPNDVMLEVTGQPTSYKIIEKNGAPYSFDNGNSNVFEDIEPAEYVFSIEDDCGNIITKWFNVQSLPSIADATQPDDMIMCVEEGEVVDNIYHLTDQNEAVLGPLHSSMYTITYHLSYEDADAGENPLPEYYTSQSNGQTIYVRLKHNEIAICHGITSFRLFMGEYETPVIATEGTICDDGHIALTATGNFDSYLWSTGETTRTIYVEQAGNYAVIAAKEYGTATCDSYANVLIKQSVTPNILKIETKDWTTDHNMIIVYAEGGNFEYSLDGINYQASNVFTGLETGVYTVYVKDINGCGVDTKDVALLNYPNYFTPNGDGIHDTWYIKYAAVEPNIKIDIFDRYGKLITTFGSTSKGWDGTLNGIQLPSTDYWFVVTRENGTQHRGHFAMLR